MTEETFNRLPMNIKQFIEETSIDIKHIATNDFTSSPNKYVYFTIPYGIHCKAKDRHKVCKRFTSKDAIRVLKWWKENYRIIQREIKLF